SDKGLVYNLYNEDPKTYVAPGGAVSSIAVAGQAGIGPVPAAGSKPSTSATAPTTSAATPATISAAMTTSTAVSATNETSRAPLPTSKITTVTVRSSSEAVPTVTSAVATPSASSCPTAPSGANSGEVVAKYYRCGGIGYTGSTNCAEGTTCVVQNPYYSQCL
ncbi:unnamed protein product, partial [Rhizoctonia solani]